VRAMLDGLAHISTAVYCAIERAASYGSRGAGPDSRRGRDVQRPVFQGFHSRGDLCGADQHYRSLPDLRDLHCGVDSLPVVRGVPHGEGDSRRTAITGSAGTERSGQLAEPGRTASHARTAGHGQAGQYGPPYSGTSGPGSYPQGSYAPGQATQQGTAGQAGQAVQGTGGWQNPYAGSRPSTSKRRTLRLPAAMSIPAFRPCLRCRRSIGSARSRSARLC